ncbi:MAG: hypothetical protein JKY24_04615 [Pseudomonadales bacterium]|nr:hypothetical protein [Pseudomonadales bacterium]
MKLYLIATLSMFLIACGGSDDTEKPDDSIGGQDTESRVLISFESTDIIDPAVANGEFLISWDYLTDSSVYNYKVSLSHNETLTQSDLVIIADSCIGGLGCETKVNHECNINNDNQIECQQITDITEFLFHLPLDAYMIIEICEDVFDCVTRSYPVQFN